MELNVPHPSSGEIAMMNGLILALRELIESACANMDTSGLQWELQKLECWLADGAAPSTASVSDATGYVEMA
jgi:hypothetical protein